LIAISNLVGSSASHCSISCTARALHEGVAPQALRCLHPWLSKICIGVSSEGLPRSRWGLASQMRTEAVDKFARFSWRRVSGRGWRRQRNLRAHAPIDGQPGQGEPAENSRTERHSEKNRTGPIELSNANGLSELFVEPTERWHFRRFRFAWRHQFRSEICRRHR
jgi:hypothetical protein